MKPDLRRAEPQNVLPRRHPCAYSGSDCIVCPLKRRGQRLERLPVVGSTQHELQGHIGYTFIYVIKAPKRLFAFPNGRLLCV